MKDQIASALHDTLISPNEADQNSEAANVVDGLFAIARALHCVAAAIEDVKSDLQDERKHQ